jgi:uncharacterized DUF497 family protein
MSVKFEWDKNKAATNLKRHRVSFDEARTVFNDPLARIFDDEEHSRYEQREIIIGHAVTQRLLLVSFIEHGEVIRIISARPATRREQRDYETNVLF